MQMRPRPRALGVLAAAVPGLRRAGPLIGPGGGSGPAFNLLGRPVGGARPAAPTPAYLTGARIMADGEGALVIDADSGALLRTDAAGKNLGQVAIARDAGLMTYDAAAQIAYVADRRNDRIAVVHTDTMMIASSIATAAEPAAACRAVRRGADARPEPAPGLDDRRPHAGGVRRGDRPRALAHRARQRAARPRGVARRHARPGRLSHHRHGRSDRSARAS